MTIKIGLFGTGGFGKMHADLLSAMDGVEISAICGSSQQKAESMARDYPNARGYGSVTEMLDDRRLDAAYVCVPPFAHAHIEESLVQRDIPFFVEKPLAADLETPTRIRKAVEEKKLLTSVGYHFRYMDGTARAQQLLEDRTVGMAIGYMMGNMPGVYWWRKQEGSGGQFVEQTTHIVDLLRYLLGDVDEVYAAFAGRFMHTKEDGVEVPDVGTVTLKMKSGAVATISNTCMLPMGHTAGLHVYTDTGVLEVSGTGLKEFAAGRTTEYASRSNPYELENKAFIHALRTGDASGILSTYSDAWRSQQAATAASLSASTNRPIKLQD
ncbi:Gfo/Idh/MocA family protein [Paenibacillus pasadenensis]|uniref:Myo-inositol 2-dehydrogenase 1 n=1 Tax=Paenibacillus pasadenensis TaxID=217090 RepID=A0A2N5N8Y9_9BACL|nr:Gfo/Idh/MocA family oxidoreductase [Paenibacillus pasadenensis]PLT46793.1 Myo-inositol 2-dehydrogenase 1 [Paenibacillus pasadenensis]